MAHTDPPARRRTKRCAAYALLAGLLCGGGSAHALAPHEVALLVNTDSPASLEVANAYAEARGIPLANRIYLALPAKVRAAAGGISPEEFRQAIWTPARAYLHEQGLEDHILAWVYSVDFPYRITTEPAMSIHGLTLLRGDVPPSEWVDKAQYVSPYYAGPDEPGGPQLPSRALTLRHLPAPAEMPVPSFSLGHVGARGLSTEEVLENLARSRAADHSAPPGPVLFLTNDNIRSTARAWQFSGAVSELHALGRKAEILDSLPRQASGLVGLMTGRQQVPGQMRDRFAPGALADHLTSHAANFSAWMQGKCTIWLQFGAAASAGTVTEPYALWPKFPHARLHVHYAAGLTALESFYQALRCPLQLFLVGDPLCAPFAPRLTLELSVDVADDESHVTLSSHLTGPRAGTRAEYTLYLNDQIVGQDQAAAPRRISTRDLPDGAHTLRLVAELPTPLRPATAAEATFLLQRQGRGAALLHPSSADGLLIDRPHPFTFETRGEPARVHLYSGRLRLDTATPDAGTLTLQPARLGAGPNQLHAVAEYADGQRVASPSIAIRIREPGRTAIRVTAEPDAGRLRLQPDIQTDAHRIAASWYRRLDPVSEPGTFRTRGGTLSEGGEGARLVAEARPAVITERRPARRGSPAAVRADLQIPGAARDALAGIAFNVRNENNFDFFGMHGSSSAWVFGSMSRGNLTLHPTVGHPLRRNRWVNLHLRRGSDGMEGLVDGRIIARWPRGDWGRGDIGIFARNAEVTFRDWMESPPTPVKQDDGMRVLVDATESETLTFVAWDGFRFVSARYEPPSPP